MFKCLFLLIFLFIDYVLFKLSFKKSLKYYLMIFVCLHRAGKGEKDINLVSFVVSSVNLLFAQQRVTF